MNLKELLEYIFGHFKFWITVNEWQSGVHLRFGGIKRSVGKGMYIKLPIIDQYFVQPNRTQEIQAIQINCLTKDSKDLTISASVFYKIDDIHKFYTTYSEPNEIISCLHRS